jgi:hypothetical protein
MLLEALVACAGVTLRAVATSLGIPVELRDTAPRRAVLHPGPHAIDDQGINTSVTLYKRSLRKMAPILLIGLAVPTAVSAAPFPTSGPPINFKRHHHHHHRHHHHLYRTPMTVSSSLGGGGEITVKLRWVAPPSEEGLISGELLIEFVSMRDVPANCTSVSEDGQGYVTHPTRLSGSQIFNLTTQMPGFGMSAGNPEVEPALTLRVGAYDEKTHELFGIADIETEQGTYNCLNSTLEPGWTAKLHGWQAP